MLFFDASFFVALSFGIVVLIGLKLGLHDRVILALDTRAATIKADLDDARKLREEALAVLGDYKKRALEVEKDVLVLIEQAQEDAKLIAQDAGIAMQARLERRTEQAEEKIARMEAQLIQEIRRTSANLAVEAAALLIADKMTAAQSHNLVKNTINDLAKNFH